MPHDSSNLLLLLLLLPFIDRLYRVWKNSRK